MYAKIKCKREKKNKRLFAVNSVMKTFDVWDRMFGLEV